MTDAGGDLKESFYYEPFGQRIDAQGKPLASPPAEVGSGFTGHEHDEDLGLINMRGRIYDPLIRRFLSPDPHVTNPLSGQSYNRYSYVLNNPTNLVDPTGFDCIGQECSGEGTEYSPSSGFTSSPANDYSGAFFRTDSNGSIASSGFSGFSGSAVGGSGLGAPVQAAERQRLVSMPTGPAAPAGAICGPEMKAESAVSEDVEAAASAAAPLVPPPPRPFTPGNQFVPAYIGNDVHDQIGSRYEEMRPNQDIYLNYVQVKSIAEELGGNVSALGISGLLKPDIVNATTREIYEIKKSGSEPAGRLQLAMYSTALAKAGIVVVPGGSGPGTHGILSAPGGYYQYWTQEPGIITYQWVTPHMRPWGVAPEAWVVGGGVALVVVATAGVGLVGLAPAAAPETVGAVGGLVPAF